MVVDALSRINAVGASCTEDVVGKVDFNTLANEQEKSGETASYRTADTGLVLKDIHIDTLTFLGDTFTRDPRPVLPTS